MDRVVLSEKVGRIRQTKIIVEKYRLDYLKQYDHFLLKPVKKTRVNQGSRTNAGVPNVEVDKRRSVKIII